MLLIFSKFEMPAQAIPFKGCVIGVLDAAPVEEPAENFLRQIGAGLCQVYHLHRCPVQ